MAETLPIRRKKVRNTVELIREYRSWNSMITRCYNPKAASYRYYGGKGIKVCEEWKSNFRAFYKDMGPRPEGTTLDRIDGNKDYEPGNCRWATVKQQIHNRSIWGKSNSGVPGVTKHVDGRWSVKISISGRRKHLGYFTDLQEAINARKAAEIKYKEGRYEYQ